MYRELMSYSTSSITASETYSLSFQCSQFKTHIFLNFWSGNVFYQICLGAGPRGILIPKRLMGTISAFLGLFDSPPSCVCLVDCPEKLCTCLKTSLPGKLNSASVNGFNQAELERCLSIPTSRVLERHDYRTILECLLMKLRTALDRDWLQSLPTLHKVHKSLSAVQNLQCAWWFLLFYLAFSVFLTLPIPLRRLQF